MPARYDDDDTGADIIPEDTGFAEEEAAALLGEDNGIKPGSLLASVAKRAASYVAKPTRIEVPAVPGLFAEFSTALETRQLNRIRAASERYPEKPLRLFRFNLLLLGHYNVGLYLNNERLLDGNGQPVTFRSRELWEQFDNVTDMAGAVHAMYGFNDFAVTQAANALMSDAGLDEDLARQDPS